MEFLKVFVVFAKEIIVHYINKYACLLYISVLALSVFNYANLYNIYNTCHS